MTNNIALLREKFRTVKDIREYNRLLDEAEKLLRDEELLCLREFSSTEIDNLFVKLRIDGRIKTLEEEKLKKTKIDASSRVAQQHPVAANASKARQERFVNALESTSSDEVYYIAKDEFLFYAHELTKPDRLLIEAIIKDKLGAIFCGVSIKPLKPGFSGSTVFLLRPIVKLDDGNMTVRRKAYVAKLGDPKKLEEEYRRAREAATRSNSHPVELKIQDGRACLLQEVASNSFNEKTTALKIQIWPSFRVGSAKGYEPLENISERLVVIHQQIKTWHDEKTEKNDSVSKAFQLPISQIKDKRLKQRLANVGIDLNSAIIDKSIFNFEIVNPYWYLNKLLRQDPKIVYFEQPLHGDLHTENIQVDSSGQPHFIDWGNSQRGHSSLDYSLLETSVFAHCLPTDYPLPIIAAKIATLPYPGDPKVDQIILPSDIENPMNRCEFVIRTIRKFADELLATPRDLNYAAGIFFCATQQLQYEDSNLSAVLAIADNAIRKLDADWGFLE